MNSADTRFHNDKVRAQQASMGNNLSAINSLPTTHSAKRNRPAGPPVGAPPSNNLSQLVPPPRSAPAPLPQRPTGPPSGFKPMYAQAAPIPGEAPQQQANPALKGIMNEIHTDNLVNSPDMVAAYTKVKLRDYFHGRQSPDAGRQVLEILNANQ